MSTDADPPADEPTPPEEGPERRCFVVAAFGSTADERRRSAQVLKYLIRPALGPRFEVKRADEIDEDGLINDQVIDWLVTADLVIADLTHSNPNVFYEVGVRHSAGYPIVHLMTRGQTLPFDIAGQRAIFYALDDPDYLSEARDAITRAVAAIEGNGWEANPNPVTSAMQTKVLRESPNAEVRAEGALLSAIDRLSARLDRVEAAEPTVYTTVDDWLTSPTRPRRGASAKHGVTGAALEALAARLAPIMEEDVRADILTYLSARVEGAELNQIADALNLDSGSIAVILSRMMKDGQVRSEEGRSVGNARFYGSQ